MDKITIKNARFYGYHGVLPEEGLKGQFFFVDIELGANIERASETDQLEDTVDYSAVFYTVKEIVETEKYMLIEKLAGTIAASILNIYSKVLEVTVRVRKPDAPINGVFDWTEIEIKRCRNEA